MNKRDNIGGARGTAKATKHDAVDRAVKASFPASDPPAIGGSREHECLNQDGMDAAEIPGIELPAQSPEECEADEIRTDRAPFYVHDADRLREERELSEHAGHGSMQLPEWLAPALGLAAAFGIGVLVGRATAVRHHVP